MPRVLALLVVAAARSTVSAEAAEGVPPKRLLAGLTLAAALGGGVGQAPGGASDDVVVRDADAGAQLFAAHDALGPGLSVSAEDPPAVPSARSFMRTVLDAARNTVEAEEEEFEVAEGLDDVAEDLQTDEEKEKEQEAAVNRVREAIVRIYKKKNPSKLEELPRIFGAYEGRERYLYEKLCAKYDVPVEKPGEEKTDGHFGDWGGFATAAFPAAGAMQLFNLLQQYAKKRHAERQKEKKRKQKAAERARVKQEILDDDSLSEEEKKVKIDALYAKPRTQKEMPMF